jgi:SAM-dependent methyltransferase
MTPARGPAGRLDGCGDRRQRGHDVADSGCVLWGEQRLSGEAGLQRDQQRGHGAPRVGVEIAFVDAEDQTGERAAGAFAAGGATNADRYTRMLAGYADIVADAAAFALGERVVDVGCGCGDLSLTAGRAVGAPGAVTGVDLSPAMLAVAAARADDAGLGHVEFVASDAATYAPDPAGFDVVVSRFGVRFFDDPIAAFTHLHALMAPGGRLAFVSWQDLFANDWMMMPGAAVAEVLPLPVG